MEQGRLPGAVLAQKKVQPGAYHSRDAFEGRIGVFAGIFVPQIFDVEYHKQQIMANTTRKERATSKNPSIGIMYLIMF